MQPNRTQTHIDQFLTDVSIGLFQDPAVFIGGTVLPTKEVPQQSNRYVVYNGADFARDDAKLRAGGTESNGSGYGMSSDSYFCDRYALHVDRSYDEISVADSPIDLDREDAAFLMHQMLIRRERLVASTVFRTGVWSLDVLGAATSQWNDYAASDPIAVIDSAARGLLLGSFNAPTTLILGLDVFNALKQHPDLNRNIMVDRQLDLTGMARLLGVDQVVVPKAVVNLANEGKPASTQFIWDPKSALLMSNTKTVGNRVPTAAMNFAWTGVPGLPRPMGIVSRAWDMIETQSRRVESEICMDCKITSSALGVFFNGIVS